MSFELLGVTAVASMVAAVLAGLFIIAFDAVDATPVTGTHDLVPFGTGSGGGLLLRGAIGGVEVGGEGGEHGF